MFILVFIAIYQTIFYYIPAGISIPDFHYHDEF